MAWFGVVLDALPLIGECVAATASWGDKGNNPCVTVVVKNGVLVRFNVERLEFSPVFVSDFGDLCDDLFGLTLSLNDWGGNGGLGLVSGKEGLEGCEARFFGGHGDTRGQGHAASEFHHYDIFYGLLYYYKLF